MHHAVFQYRACRSTIKIELRQRAPRPARIEELPYARDDLRVRRRDVLGLGATGFGYLMAANGIGAFAGAVTLATLGDYPHKRRLMSGGACGFSIMLLIFSLSMHAAMSALALALAGWFMIIFFATANTLVQLQTPDELRGRVMGIYSLCFMGSAPIGSLIAGALARWTDAPTTTCLGALVCLLAALGSWKIPGAPSQSNPPTGRHIKFH